MRKIARLVGAASSSASRWKRALEREGIGRLRARRHLGKPPKLTSQQKQVLAGIRRARVRAAGFATDLWTLARAA